MERKAQEKENPVPNQALMDDVGTALRFVEEDYESTIPSVDSLVATKEITWDLLWTICPPKAEFLAPRYGLMHQMQVFYVVYTGYHKRENGSKYFEITGKIVTHDGTNFGWGDITIEIDQFEGASRMNSLKAFPLIYHPDYETVSDRLIVYGRRYVSIVDQPTCFEYVRRATGNASGIKEVVLSDGKRKPERFNVQDNISYLFLE